MPDTLPDDGPAAGPVEDFRRLWADGGRPDVVAFLAADPDLQPDIVVDVLRLDQKERWARGEVVPAEWYLEQFPHITLDENGPLVLIYGEVLARTERGERPALADFILRFPQYAEFLTLQWEVHDALEGAATRHGTTLTFEGPPGDEPTPIIQRPTVPGYEIEEEVGRGAVGAVYRARQAAINRPCALKVVLEGQTGRTDKLTRFFEEGRAIARFKHPNIVGIYDLGTHETGPFMALEWVGGGTLADRIAGTPLPPTEAAKLATTLARAVGYAHEHGVIHRDLKPANVLMTEAGEPKIADFGLAKLLNAVNPDGSLTAGQPLGTPTYMAPEQTGTGRGEVSPAADVYSLGAVLYEMLTGRVPLAGSTIHDTLRLVAEQEPVPPQDLNAAIPKDLETICLKCLEKDPKKRYSNGTALADDLTRYLTDEPIAARPTRIATRAGRWLRRHPGAAIFAATGAVIVLVATASVAGGLVRLKEGEKARVEVQGREWRALVSEARAVRHSGRAGQRTDALAKLREARGILATLTGGQPAADDLAVLRNEAIACLVLPDVEAFEDDPLPAVYFFREMKAGTALPSMDAASADGRLGVVADEPAGFWVFDLVARRLLCRTLGGQIIPGRVAFGSDSRTLAFAVREPDGRGERVFRFRVHVPPAYRVELRPDRAADGPPSVASPDRTLSARGGNEFGVIVLAGEKVNASPIRFEIPEPTLLRPLAFQSGPEGALTLAAVGTDSRVVHTWDLKLLRAELRELGLDW
jgi:serine/threonine-protein kinase